MVVLIPTYGQEIVTGLCGCLGFVNGAIIDGNEVTFIVRMVDNEPIRGIELDIYHDNPDLVYSGVDKGDKLEDLTDSEGTPRTMTLLGNYLEDRLKGPCIQYISSSNCRKWRRRRFGSYYL